MRLGVATLSLSFLLLAGASVHAQAPPPAPPEASRPTPGVAQSFVNWLHNVAGIAPHRRQRSMPPLPRPRPAELAATSDAPDNAPAAQLHSLRKPPVETRAATNAAVSPRSPDSGDEIMPAFDVALIGRTGDAVIAGTAAPGAAVELLRNGESYERAIADQFGHFVMVPSRLPPGDYELTLRSRQPNGKHATSRRSVAVAVQPSQTDQNMALTTSDKASAIPAKSVVVPSIVRHPSRARHEAKGPAAQDVSGLRPKLFNHVLGSHQ